MRSIQHRPQQPLLTCKFCKATLKIRRNARPARSRTVVVLTQAIFAKPPADILAFSNASSVRRVSPTPPHTHATTTVIGADEILNMSVLDTVGVEFLGQHVISTRRISGVGSHLRPH
jgi:hypothetical protein